MSGGLEMLGIVMFAAAMCGMWWMRDRNRP